jgi:pimeloyl-ACP methyl ester carboxylesterase
MRLQPLCRKWRRKFLVLHTHASQQTGHLASLEQPEAFNEAVLRFLKMHS